MAMRLSVAAIERLKPDTAKRLEIADAGKPGLYLVIQPNGRKSWAVRYRIDRQSRKLTLEGFPSLTTARRLAQDALDLVAATKDPARLKKAARNAPPGPHGQATSKSVTARRSAIGPSWKPPVCLA